MKKYFYCHKDKNFDTFFDAILSPLDPETFLDSLRYDLKSNYKNYKNFVLYYLGEFDNLTGQIKVSENSWSFDCDEYYSSIIEKEGDINGKEESK